MRFDIFCHVVDNYGDAGVSLRLIKRLAHTHFSSSDHFTSSKDSFRLFCDQTELIKKLAGEDTLRDLSAHGVEILDWNLADKLTQEGSYPDVVIETFSCTIPEVYNGVIREKKPPLIVNVEYLSAEPWTLEAHGLPSIPGNTWDLPRYFYYPGFTPNSGGLLQGKSSFTTEESNYVPRSLELIYKEVRQTDDVKKVLIFTYGGDKLIRLLNQMSESKLPLDLLICDEPSIKTAETWLGESLNQPRQRDSLRCIGMPFVCQDDFDWLLNKSDLNIVRGEDSFVRAQWAGKPFIWDIYPQDVDAHLIKLDAFLDLYLKDANMDTKRAVLESMYWQDFSNWWPQLRKMSLHATMWRQDLIKSQINGDLAIRLRDFIHDLLKKG